MEEKAIMHQELTQKDKKKLKGLGHHLKPVLRVGKEGLTEGVMKSLNKSLDDHELIKIQFLETAGLDRKEDAQKLADRVKADVIQILGYKTLLYRYNSTKKKHVMDSVL